MRCRKPGSTVQRRPSFSASPSGSCATGCSASASAMKIGPDGLLPQARYIASPNCDERPPGAAITLLVLHSISLPPGQYGGDAIELLFTNRLDPAAHPYFRDIATLKLSSHFLARRALRLGAPARRPRTLTRCSGRQVAPNYGLLFCCAASSELPRRRRVATTNFFSLAWLAKSFRVGLQSTKPSPKGLLEH